jgi:hypothetical protein
MSYEFVEALRALAQEHGYRMQSVVDDDKVSATFTEKGGWLTRRYGKAMDRHTHPSQDPRDPLSFCQ